ncbi:MAG: hypothetical protein K0B37_15785, partial [Bacteroidales bacterium]|nr:hypothetical protein [Bacteroidales bacterium]
QSNLEYVQGEELKILQEVYNHPKPYSGTIIRDAKAAMDKLESEVLGLIEEEKALALEKIEESMRKLKSTYEFGTLHHSSQDKILSPFLKEMEKVKQQRFIANIRQVKENVGQLVTDQLNVMMELLKPLKPVETSGDSKPEVQEPKPRYVNKNNVRFSFDKNVLQTEQDVEEYVEALKNAFLEQIRNNRRINL